VEATVDYTYDDANRLDTVDAVSYTFDANGNLLDDGVNTYTYDPANRLSTVDGPSSTVNVYNGLGDRLQQTVDEVTTTYVVDLNAGLTQVLDDGTNTYLYGNGRIAQVAGATTEYFLGDALGSVRQMTDAAAVITLAKSYDPYGVASVTSGAGTTSYGFTGEQYDSATGLVYLRSRHYSPGVGRFLSRDTWDGDINNPLSLNRWNYVDSNPVNRVDPSGRNPNCWSLNPFACADERFNEIVNIDTLTAHKNAFTLVSLFEDVELGTLWTDQAGSTVSKRLSWVLDKTRGFADGGFAFDECIKEASFPMQFGRDADFGNDDLYFKEELRDNQFYNKDHWANAGPSNQVGHFLSAVALGFSHPDFITDWFVIGHELKSDKGGVLNQLFGVTDQMKKGFTDAISADERGDNHTRDQLLWSILGFPASVAFGDVDPSRQGNSLQDLRLTVKGYRFGKWAAYNYLPPVAAARWLRRNILIDDIPGNIR